MRITDKLARDTIKGYYNKVIGFAPTNKDIIIKDIKDGIITASINGQHRQFKINITIDIEDITNITDIDTGSIVD